MSSTGIGLSGAHRTGKTTLAQAFAQRNNIPFVRTSASEVFQIIGKDPKLDYPIEERILIQEAILYAFERQYKYASEQSSVWISDRTPIDLASYMLADVQRETLAGQEEMAQFVLNYVSRCIESANRWFQTMILIQPGIPLVNAPGKAGICPANIEHINLIQVGLFYSGDLHSGHYLMPRKFTSLEDRLIIVSNAMKHTERSGQAVSESRLECGMALH